MGQQYSSPGPFRLLDPPSLTQTPGRHNPCPYLKTPVFRVRITRTTTTTIAPLTPETEAELRTGHSSGNDLALRQQTDESPSSTPRPLLVVHRNVRRDLPSGLSERDTKILREVKKWAGRLEKRFSPCGVRFGWASLIGLIPIVGDGINAGINFVFIIKKAEEAEIPRWLLHRMLLNNFVSAGVGLVPLIGDVAVALFKTSSRNAALLEEYMCTREEERAIAKLFEIPL